MAYPILERIIPPIAKLWLRKIEGMENVPKDKPFIIVANHASYYDAMLVPCLIIPWTGKKMHPFVNSAYWKPFIARIFLNHGECIPVYVNKEKDAGEKNNKAFDEAMKYIKRNEPIMIFPEGSRSYDGELKKAYNGVAKLVLKSKIPVLPFGIINSHKVLPKDAIFPRFKRCEVKIGKQIYFDKYYNKKINDKNLEDITRKIMKEIAKLIGQKYNH